MADPAFSICVYLGSRPGDNPLFTEAAVAVGRRAPVRRAG